MNRTVFTCSFCNKPCLTFECFYYNCIKFNNVLYDDKGLICHTCLYYNEYYIDDEMNDIFALNINSEVISKVEIRNVEINISNLQLKK